MHGNTQRELVCNTKVGNLDTSIQREQHIPWLDVSMHNALDSKVCEHSDNIPCNVLMYVSLTCVSHVSLTYLSLYLSMEVFQPTR